MRLVLPCLFVSCAVQAVAQDHLDWEPKQVVRTMLASTDSLYTVHVDSTLLPTQLRVDVVGPHPFTGTYFFADPDWYPHCDSIVYRYSCSPCFDSLVARVIADPADDWLMLGPDRYIKARSTSWTRTKGDKERTYECTVLQVQRTPGDPQCGTLIYSFLPLPKRQRKELIQRLRCERLYHPFWGNFP